MAIVIKTNWKYLTKQGFIAAAMGPIIILTHNKELGDERIIEEIMAHEETHVRQYWLTYVFVQLFTMIVLVSLGMDKPMPTAIAVLVNTFTAYVVMNIAYGYCGAMQKLMEAEAYGNQLLKAAELHGTSKVSEKTCYYMACTVVRAGVYPKLNNEDELAEAIWNHVNRKQR